MDTEGSSDANFAEPLSEGGFLVLLTGMKGSTYPVEWEGKRLPAATSSTDAETIEMTAEEIAESQPRKAAKPAPQMIEKVWKVRAAAHCVRFSHSIICFSHSII